ncbi:ABC transporter ATP-binding protein [Halosegnis longus]|uniref:ABC transporter ATP-binding protein n=1 Tax=Halosegnis longus TaxID=2216012 RepID=UPI00129E6F9D|nr:oligopeptide/dipeptide ABC transporter ATP-binding protein [Halosegnis longus]
MSEDPLLAVEDLEKHYPIREGLLRRTTGHVKAVDGISFEVKAGETVGLVGESGCGKSTAAEAILRLQEPTGGTVRFDGEPVADHDSEARERFRRRTGVVFQDPNTAFDPRMTVAESVAEPLEIHGIDDADRRRDIVAELLEGVGLGAGALDRYPDSFSGGQKQRIALARALVLNPDLLVADEPVSALDVSIQADILQLLEELSGELGLSVLFISHDLGVVREVCDRVVVMYLGEVVENAPVEELFESPQHPYTRALLGSIPDPDPTTESERADLTGDVPDPADPPSGCSFHPRCPAVIPTEGYEFAEGVFRSVLDLRLAVESGEVDPEAFDGKPAVRAAYDVPATLTDDEAEAELDAALDELLDGHEASAADRLAETFTTVCERENPEPTADEEGRVAACHLHATR